MLPDTVKRPQMQWNLLDVRRPSALFAAVIVFAFVAPMGAAAGRLSPCGVFALGLAACGLVQTLAAMKRRESESSNQP